ncbi:MAG: PD40 domain-containing protein [Bacteroidetes bacterium]|nr:PD40 domain-containing protein [Bacteroidota bacterium]
MTFILFATLLFSSTLFAQEEARLLRFPTIHNNQLVFCYAGDLYSVDANGGMARKLTTSDGYEMFPKFSPDGKNIAFTAQYDGNTEVYIIPATGGVPRRVTYTATLSRDDLSDRMGPNNIVMTWKDNEHIIYRSRRWSFNPFKGQLFVADINGGLNDTPLPFSVAGFCSYSPDGKQLAYNWIFREFRTWKYYHGGMADDIHVYDFASRKTINITNDTAQDIEPMWTGTKIYYLSDKSHTMNLFEYDMLTNITTQVTNYTDYDIKFASLGNNAIVWERAGYIWKMDLATQQVSQVHIEIGDDNLMARSVMIDASKFQEGADLSPDGNRLLLIGRGDIWTLPAKTGITRDITQTSGIHERDAYWSPDGRKIAYISDSSGEDEIYIKDPVMNGTTQRITSNSDNYKFDIKWSPDGKKILWSDRKMHLYYVDVATKKQTLVDTSNLSPISNYDWSPDSKWITYDKPAFEGMQRILLYNVAAATHTEVTGYWYVSYQPVFSKDGKYLLFVSARDFNPTFSNIELDAAFINMNRVYLIPLSNKTENPLAPKDDEVKTSEDTSATKSSSEKKSEATETSNTEIDLTGIGDRILSLPIAPSNYFNIYCKNDNVYYLKISQVADDEPHLMMYSLKDRKESDLGAYDNYQVSADGKKILLMKHGKYYITTMGSDAFKPDASVSLNNMQIMVNKHEEWQQIYNEAWRQMRDFFYSPTMNGADWKAMHDKYEPLVPYIGRREDLTYLIGEMIGELSSGHTYTGGGDEPKILKINTGLLGAQFARDASGYFMITKLLKGANWDATLTSPLTEVGVDAKVGDYIISINDIPVNTVNDIYEILINQAGKQVQVSINSKPSSTGAHTVIVKPIADESNLYYYDWVQHNIAYVDSATNGQVGYIHIPDMGLDGLDQFMRLYWPQLNKKALIIDDRGNGGGFVSPIIANRLSQKLVFFDLARNTIAQTDPSINIGPKVLLTDQYSASDGDIFPYRFRTYHLGTIIGRRTWGGVIGINGTLPFVDGGFLNKPEFGRFAPNGDWVIESHGVDPDIAVDNDPAREYSGTDDQLNKAIEVIKGQIKTEGKEIPPVPPFPDRVHPK